MYCHYNNLFLNVKYVKSFILFLSDTAKMLCFELYSSLEKKCLCLICVLVTNEVVYILKLTLKFKAGGWMQRECAVYKGFGSTDQFA